MKIMKVNWQESVLWVVGRQIENAGMEAYRGLFQGVEGIIHFWAGRDTGQIMDRAENGQGRKWIIGIELIGNRR